MGMSNNVVKMMTRKRLLISKLIGQNAALVRKNSIGDLAAELTDMINETNCQLIVYMMVVLTCQNRWIMALQYGRVMQDAYMLTILDSSCSSSLDNLTFSCLCGYATRLNRAQ